MSEDRLADYLDHMSIAASNAFSFVAGMSRKEFLADKRTQQAVVMSLVIVGEAAAKIMDQYGDCAAVQSTIPWRGTALPTVILMSTSKSFGIPFKRRFRNCRSN